jgi:hypothetical protein
MTNGISSVIITITAKVDEVNNMPYNYSGDRILCNIFTGDHEIYYSGQNQGLMDYKLLNAIHDNVLFRVYYRNNTREFIFLGFTNNVSVVRERTVQFGINSSPNQRLFIKLIIPHQNIRNERVYTDFVGTGKYKKAVLRHSGFNTNTNVFMGFYSNIS